MFSMKPKTGAGICWYVKWEQIVEIHSIGIERIMAEIVPISTICNFPRRREGLMTELINQKRLPSFIFIVK
jgi:hypothetical protein